MKEETLKLIVDGIMATESMRFALNIGAISNLLVAKGIVTEEELKESLVLTTKEVRADQEKKVLEDKHLSSTGDFLAMMGMFGDPK